MSDESDAEDVDERDGTDKAEDAPPASPPASPRLKPARPDAAEGDSYKPRFPWRWVGVAVVLAGAAGGFYYLRETQKAEQLRGQMLQVHQRRLGRVRDRYSEFRGQIERWVTESAQAGEPDGWVDPQLNIDGLRTGDGLYLRIPASQATSAEDIDEAARAMTNDAITRCLGITPSSARGLFQQGQFLTPAWIEDVENERSTMRLRVLDDQLQRHIAVDVPVVSTLMSAQWFLLVLEQGENRRDHPVDVYLWDLSRQRQLLRARIQGRGLLVPVRIGLDGAPRTRPSNMPANAMIAYDCSIASQLRAMTGSAPVEFDSSGELLERDRERRETAAGSSEAEPAETEPAETEDESESESGLEGESDEPTAPGSD